MTSALDSPVLVALLAAATIAAAVGFGLLAARAARRGARRLARDRTRDFEVALDEFLAGHRTARELRRVADALDRDSFWNVLDAVCPGRTRRACHVMERALERTTHVGDERRALRDDSPWRRELAARRLAWIGARRHERALRRAMIAGPALVSLAAVTALGRARDPLALRWLLAHPEAFSHRSPRALGAALHAFGRGAAPILLAALERGLADPVLERASLDTLALAGYDVAIPAVAARLEHPWRDVRVAAARALGRLGAGDCAGALIEALGDPEWQVRAQAAHALGLLGASEAAPALADALRDRAWWVRRHAAYALAGLGADGVATLRAIAAHDADAYARDIAAEALAGGFPAADSPRPRAS